jgi:shikimate dehydrogenase
MTDRYALSASRWDTASPADPREFARQTAQDLTYEAIEAPIGGFADAVDRFRAAGGRGSNVTLPFKLDAFAYATECTDRARHAGAVNCMKFEGARVMAENFDGLGLVNDIQRNLGCPLRGRACCCWCGRRRARRRAALLEQDPEVLVIENRTVAKAKSWASSSRLPQSRHRRLCRFCRGPVRHRHQRDIREPARRAAAGSACGLRQRLFRLRPGLRKGADPFLQLARDAGAGRVADGIGMLVEQAAEAFVWWRGVRPPTAG